MSFPPPLPPPLPAAARSQPAQKPSNRNGCLIALAVCAVAGIALSGILAAIAIPAYQTYVLRSKVGAVINATRPLQASIDAKLARGSECPGKADNDFNVVRGIERIEVGQLAEDATRCVYAVHLGGTGSTKLDGKTIWMDRAKQGNGRWNCRSDIDNAYLPHACRED